MAVYFFLSYARANDYGEVEKFFDDLSRAIRVAEGKDQSETVGFFDKRNIELGKEWKPEIINALQRCRTMVCLFSPAYFKSEYCGKEWQVFRQRQDLYVERQRNGGNALDETMGASQVPIARPPVIIPVLWVPIKEKDIPSIVSEAQYKVASPAPTHEEQGLEFLRKHYNYEEYSRQYDLYINQLAQHILNAAEKFDLPALESAPRLGDVPNPFFDRRRISNRRTIDFVARATQPFSEAFAPAYRRIARIAAIAGTALLAILIAVGIWFYSGSAYLLDCGEETDYKSEGIVQWTPADLGWNLQGKQGRNILGNKVGFFKTAVTKNPFCIYRDFRLNLTVRFLNGKGVAWVIRAQDENNYYLFELCTSKSPAGEKKFNFYICENGKLKLLGTQKVLPDIDQESDSFFITTEAIGAQLTNRIDVKGVVTTLGIFENSRFPEGGIGFRPMNEMEVLVTHFHIVPM